MAATYEPIATTTLGSAASSITFSAISNAFTDLRVVLVETSSSTATQRIRFNSDTGTNYSTTILYGTGAAAGSAQFSSSNGIISDYYSGGSATPSMKTFDVFSYAGSTNKTVLITNSNDKNGSGAVERMVGLWRNTAAITSITITRDGGNYNTGTTATIYGIKSA